MSLRLNKRDEQAFEELLKRIKRRECVLFLGAGVSREVGLPSGTDLALSLARECNYPPTRPLTLSQVAQYYAHETPRGRLGLFQRVRELLERPITTRGLSSYDLIVEIEQLNHPIVTTNWDDQLEQAFRRKDKPVTVIRYNEQVPFLGQPHAIIKLHGDFGNRLDEIVLTRDDYVRTYRQVTQPGGLFALLGSWLATRTMLFVGYSLEDEDFQLLFEHVTSTIGAGAPIHCAVMPAAAPSFKDYWRSRGIFILDCRALPFFEEVFIRTRRFVNREDELEYICTRATKPYIEIYGFAGCGKTELLREVADRYELTGKWVQAFISFEDRQTSMEPLDLVAEIMRQTVGREPDRRRLVSRAQAEIATEKGIEPAEVPESEAKARAAKLAAAELGDYLAHQRALLLFDSSEWVPTPLLRWIENVLIPTLEEKVLDPQEQLRLVFAGRSPLPWRSYRVKSKLHPRALTPFSEGAVGAMLDSFAALKLRDPLLRAKRVAIITGVLNITSGHPKCIRNVLEELTRQEFDIPADYFVADRARLFKHHVEPVVEGEVLSKVPEELRDIFRLVCVFRRLMPDTLGALIQEGQIGRDFPDPMLLLGELRDKTRLIVPKPDPMYDIDPVVRRILAMKMELKEPDRYRQLNELAARNYEHWILGCDAAGEPLRHPATGELQVTYIVEGLFHLIRFLYLEGKRGDAAAKAVQDKLKGYLQTLRPALGPTDLPRQIEQLKDRLEYNHELLAEVSALVSDDGYRVLVDPLETFLAKL